MLFVLFKLGNDRYALEASRVIEIVPLLEIKRIPAAPRGVAGIFNYRGRPVPAVDLCELALGSPCRERLSTRIIIVNHPDGRGGEKLLGLIAESATETLRKDASAFVDSGLQGAAPPYFGAVLMDEQGVIQWVREQRLLSENVRDLLFAQNAALGDTPPSSGFGAAGVAGTEPLLKQ
jgi:chemotaxis-related protein WspB